MINIRWSTDRSGHSKRSLTPQVTQSARNRWDSTVPFEDGGMSLFSELASLFLKVLLWEKDPTSWSKSRIVTIFIGDWRNNALQLSKNQPSLCVFEDPDTCYPSQTLSIKLRYRKEQAGVRFGHERWEQISALRLLLKYYHIYQRPTIVGFLDIEAIFDFFRQIHPADLYVEYTRSTFPLRKLSVSKPE